MSVTRHNAHLDIHASIVFQLGEALISNEAQALLELVKNSYDADATRARVVINTQDELGPEYAFSEAKGYIVITDNGTGMTRRAVQNGWLTISNSEKRGLKRRRQTTTLGRTPLGDKGLGRLASQRLGRNLEIFTRTAEQASEYHVAFRWLDFAGDVRLSEVPIVFETFSPPQVVKTTGTVLVISDLVDPSHWARPGAAGDLQKELAQLFSPFEIVKDFRLAVRLNGEPIEMVSISSKLRETAQVRYSLSFDGKELVISGRARMAFLRPDKKDEAPLFRKLVEEDDGAEFLSFLLSKKQAESFGLRRAPQRGWYAACSRALRIETMDRVEQGNGSIANPGPFRGEIDAFDLSADVAESQSVFDTQSEYRKYVAQHSGIRVYRDGFGIRVAEDWLGLGSQWTRARSYYGLKPGNTLGYIAISARENSQLEETTDREGFKVGPAYRNFEALLQEFVRFSANWQGFLRRGWIEYRNKRRERAAGLRENSAPETLGAELRKTLGKAENHRKSLAKTAEEIATLSQSRRRLIKAVREALPASSTRGTELANLGHGIEATLQATQSAIARLEKYLSQLSEQWARTQVLIDQIDRLREQTKEVYEVASLGLTAEALSHEIQNIAERLAARTKTINQYLDKHQIRDRRITEYVEHVATAISGLRIQLAHLAPSLKYVRHKREPISMVELAKEIQAHYLERLASLQIRMEIKPTKARGFTVSMNKGKLIQVFDNLILNSEYWLVEDMRLGNIASGRILLELERPFVRVSDNGRGIEPSVETTLFEPFVTTKGTTKGRGLGLFIVQQLLDSENCTATLLPNRNPLNRRYVFELDLTGAMEQDE